MKKLLILIFTFCALVSFGQLAAPSGTLSLIPSPAMYYRPADSTVHLYKGSSYLWNRFLTSKDSAKLAQPYFTATRIPYAAATGGKLTDNANFTYTAGTGTLQSTLYKQTGVTGYYIGATPMISTYSWGGDNLNLWIGGASNSTVNNGGSTGDNGNGNIAIGTGAGSSISSGKQNMALGFYSMQNTTTGFLNTALGYNSLKSNTGGSFNTAIGSSSLQSNTGNYFNTAIGVSALQNLNSGNANTAIGYNAGYYIGDGITPFTTGSHTFLLGQGASPLANGDDNEIVIGFNSVGLGSNTVKIGTSITKTVLEGNVGIGTNTPNEMLTVSGRVFSGWLNNSAQSNRAAVGNNTDM